MIRRPNDSIFERKVIDRMMEQFNEHEILALIEGDLDDAAEQSLRQRLRSQPALMESILAMRQDRAMLRSVPEPRLPGDLLRELPMLTRPMLIQTPGTDWRRRQRMRSRLKAAALAMAAMLALGAGVGIWMAVSRLAAWPANEGSRVASIDRAADGGSSPAIVAAAAGESTWPPEDAVVHHRLPLGKADEPVLAMLGGDDHAPSPSTSTQPEILPAAFVLVVEADDPPAALEAVRAAAREFTAHAALVRNLTAADLPRHMASTGSGAQHRGANEANPAAREAVVEGSPALAPAAEQQVRFSDLGAQYTLSVRADDLPSLLARVSSARSRLVSIDSLRSGESKSASPSKSPEALWLAEAATIQSHAKALRAEHGDRIVLLPVRIESKRR
jgi:hypothetical protein